PGRHTLMALWRYENGVSMFVVGGMLGRRTARRQRGHDSLRRQVRARTAAAAVQAAQPTSDSAHYRIAAHFASCCLPTPTPIRPPAHPAGRGTSCDEFADMTPSFPGNPVFGHAATMRTSLRRRT